MLTKAEAQSRRFEQTGRRRRSGVRASLTLAGLAALAAGLLVAAPAQAGTPYATTFTHSAKSGELKGARLALRGVARRVTYVTNAGRSGVLSVRRLHRRVILPGRPATGTLHVAGHGGGDEPAFRLSRPRYNAARRTVSYRAKPLNKRRLPGRGARFGAASLSIVPHPQMMGGASGGNSCVTTLNDASDDYFQASSTSNGANQDWNPANPDPDGQIIGPGQDVPNSIVWETDGDKPGDGCSNTVTWEDVTAGAPNSGGTIEITTRWEGGATKGTYTCQPSRTVISISCCPVSVTNTGAPEWTLVAQGTPCAPGRRSR
jgi:hypothetical protein